MSLSADSAERKNLPLCTGVFDYFPAALAAISRLSKKGNDKHNPGQPLHWARGKSNDHADCIARHLLDRGTIDPDDTEYHEVKLAWRALALLQEAEEQRGAPLARGARLPKDAPEPAAPVPASGLTAGDMGTLLATPQPLRGVPCSDALENSYGEG